LRLKSHPVPRFSERLNPPVVGHLIVRQRAQYHHAIGYGGFYSGRGRLPTIALMASAPKAAGTRSVTASVAATLVVVGRGVIPNFWSITVGNALFAVAYGIIWSGARAFEGKSVSRGRREVFGPLDRSTALFDNRASRPKKLNANVGQ
jgi:hypothetical protein